MRGSGKSRLLLAVLMCLFVSCSKVENRLKELAQNPASVGVVKDPQGIHWAIPGSAIKLVEKTKVTMAPDQLVAFCTHGEGTPEDIAKAILELRDKGPTGSFGLTEMSGGATTVTTTGPDGKKETHVEGEPWKISGCVAGNSIEGKEINVAEILSVAVPKS